MSKSAELKASIDSTHLVSNAEVTEKLSKHYWTHREVGGWYEVLLVATGAGLHKSHQVVVYKRAATYDVFTRPLDDFLDRMEVVQEDPEPHWQDD